MNSQIPRKIKMVKTQWGLRTNGSGWLRVMYENIDSQGAQETRDGGKQNTEVQRIEQHESLYLLLHF